MKILFICRSYPPQIGGAEAAAERIVNLLKTKYEVDVATGTKHAKTKYYLEMEGSYCKSNGLKPLLEGTKGQYDVYFCFGFAKEFSDHTIQWCKDNKKICIFMPVGYFHTNNHRIYKKIYSTFLAKKVLNSASLILCATQIEKDFWIKKFKINEEKFRVIPHFLEDGFEEYKETNILEEKGLKEKNYILYIGRSGPNKLTKLLIKAYKDLNPEIPLVVAGLGTDSEDHEYLTYKYGIKIDKIKLLGRVSEDTKKTLIDNAKFVVFPSSYESWGLIINECMAFKTPFILSDIPVFHEIVKDSRVFFQNTVESLSQRLDLALDKPILPKVINTNSQEQYLEVFKNVKLMNKLDEHFNELKEELKNGRKN